MIDERQSLIEGLIVADALVKRLKDSRLTSFVPFERQKEALALTRENTITAVLGGNGSGKSVLLAYFHAMTATGLYPSDWPGRKFLHSTRAAVGSETYKLARNVTQRLLLGPPGEWGTGLIPGSKIRNIVRAAGSEKDLIDTVYIESAFGGVSELALKAYSQGIESWMGEAYDLIGLDEESPFDIFMQAIQRVGRRDGIIFASFTPEKGYSDVVNYIVEEKHEKVAHIFIAQDDNPFLPQEKILEMEAQTPEYLRATKRYGIPMRGVGAIYPVADERLLCDYFEIPASWRRGIGMDFGWVATAAVWMAYDAQNDCIYVYREYKSGDKIPGEHALAIGNGPPVFGDPAGGQRNQLSGEVAFDTYRDLGLDIVPGVNSHAYLDTIRERMATGRLKVMRDVCPMWFNEKRRYYRDEKGEVANKQDDHLMDAMRYGISMLHEWRAPRPRLKRVMQQWELERDPYC